MLKPLLLLISALALCACGAIKPQPSEPQDDMKRPPGGPDFASAEELRVYVDQVKPEAVSFIRYEEPFRWQGLNPFFAITEARDGPYLIEMSWECKELVSRDFYTDMADRRSTRGMVRARIDTLRGCKIENFYKLPTPATSDEQGE